MENKWLFLQKLHDIDPYGSSYYNGLSIGTELAFPEKETIEIIRYLSRNDYINTLGDNWDQLARYDIILTDKGVDFIEKKQKESVLEGASYNQIETPICFISHISSDKPLASALQAILEKKLDNKMTVFVSSDKKSLDGGPWFSQILSKIKSAMIGMVICTPSSITHPWILFETGGLATKTSLDSGDKPAFPLYLLLGKGLTIQQLPEPLKSLQVLPLGDIDRMNFIIQKISERTQIIPKDIEIKSLIEWRLIMQMSNNVENNDF